MKWSISTPPTGRVVDWATVATHLRLPTNSSEQAYVLGLIDAATDHAQEAMACSLLPQTITATYYADDASLSPPFWPVSSALNPFDRRTLALRLLRGPVSAVSAVTDANSNAVTGYTLGRIGNSDRICFNATPTFPVTVVYQAGFSAVPPAIKQAIMAHVHTLYENRGSTSEKMQTVVPHSLEAFYKLRSRNTGVG
jgi:hypothetical protein